MKPTDKPSIQIYVNGIQNQVKFKQLNYEITWKCYKVTKDKNSDNVLHLPSIWQ